ncbi:Hsp70 family protein [Nocardia sp. NPDC051570]|uniref:Hsp70 family protein n=1 Tax=Nocardia sp. NPDC051570 TaxID=3364324 RepID=UPI003793402C
MTQGLALGITVGSSNTVVVTTSSGSGDLRGATTSVRPSAPGAENFLSRVGDPVDIRTDDGGSIAAADLVAELVGRLVDGAAPAATVLGYPAWWSRHTVAAQRTALDRAELSDITLIPEPVAAVRRLEATHPATDAAPVVVYDLGTTGVTVSVVDTGPHGGLRGEPLRSTEIGGAEFDLLTMRYVLANVAGDNDFDPFDPMIERELTALRLRCAKAKEDLSGITATVVPVRLSGSVRDVRLVRGELEDLFRAPLRASLELIHQAARRAGIGTIDRILLTGGGSAIPLLTELVSTEFGTTVLSAGDPAHTAAGGAALLAAELSVTAPTESIPALPQPIPEPDRAPVLPPLPRSSQPERPGKWRRPAFIAGAAVAVAALATGTLALGTAVQSTPTSNSSGTSSSSPAAAPAAEAGSVAAPVANNDAAQGNRATGAMTPAAGKAPAGSPAPRDATGGQPAPPADNPVAAPPPVNIPIPQPIPVPEVPTIQPPVIQPPPPPTVPGGTLGNTVNNGLDQAGNTLGTVLQAPGQVLGHTGG